MAEERVQRRLAAILAADVVGYSRLMGEDEEGTHASLTAHRTQHIEPCIAEHRGRVVKTTGDGLLAEFASVVDAVRCAITFQEGIEQRNSDVPDDRRIAFRIGVNLGDVIVQDDDIFGDGVNVAARLEGLSERGAVCISEAVFQQVKGKLDVEYRGLGPQSVKNIADPVCAYLIGGDNQLTSFAELVGGVSPSLPDKPSIAVLPFKCLTGDPEQEYFADGIVDELITELSRFSDLFVIAWNSMLAYKGRAKGIQEVGRELGVAHVVEGSVRKSANRVRISVRLVDAMNSNPIWAERYDRELVDIFEVQDGIARSIVGIIPGRIESASMERLKRKQPADMAAYDYVLAGKIHHDRVTEIDNIEARRLLGRAIELEPDYATAWALMACTLGQALVIGYPENPKTVYREAIDAIELALKLNDNDVNCHRLLCEVHMEELRLDQAQYHHEKAFNLNPNDVLVVAQHGELLSWLGKHDEGADSIELAMRLDPFAAHKRAHLLGRALHAARRYRPALDAFGQINAPRYGYLADMAACHARLGDISAAERAAARVIKSKPDFSAEAYVGNLPYLQFEDRQHHLEGLSLAGLPS